MIVQPIQISFLHKKIQPKHSNQQAENKLPTGFRFLCLASWTPTTAIRSFFGKTARTPRFLTAAGSPYLRSLELQAEKMSKQRSAFWSWTDHLWCHIFATNLRCFQMVSEELLQWVGATSGVSPIFLSPRSVYGSWLLRSDRQFRPERVGLRTEQGILRFRICTIIYSNFGRTSEYRPVFLRCQDPKKSF